MKDRNAKYEYPDLHARVKGLLRQYDASVVIHPAFEPDYSSRIMIFNNFYAMLRDKDCRDRVILHDARYTYDEMKMAMSKCRWCYLWRDDISYAELRDKYEKKDESLLFHRLGDSAMLGDAADSGCELIVESKARYATYFDYVEPMTWGQFAKQIESALSSV